jgi:hypothetical protein
LSDGGNARESEIDAASRRRALIVLLVTVGIGVLAWLFLGRATDAGIDRLATIDRVRGFCDSLGATATGSANDSARIAATPLPDTVDAQSDKALRTCGDLGVSQR